MQDHDNTWNQNVDGKLRMNDDKLKQADGAAGVSNDGRLTGIKSIPPNENANSKMNHTMRSAYKGKRYDGHKKSAIIAGVVIVIIAVLAVISITVMFAMNFLLPSTSNTNAAKYESAASSYDSAYDYSTGIDDLSASTNGYAGNSPSSGFSGDDGASSAYSGEELIASESDNSNSISDLEGEQKIAYSADAYLETVDFSDASSKLDSAISDAGAIRIYDDYDSDSRSVDLRVPTDKYDMFIDSLESVATVVRCSESVDNITTDYNDLEARIESLKTQQARLNDLMSQATTVDDMLAIEDRQQEVSYELDSASRSLSSMNADIEYANVSVRLYDVSSDAEDGSVGAEEDFGTRISKAFQQSIDDFVSYVKDFVIVLVSSWTWIVAIAVLIAIIISIVAVSTRKKRNRNMSRNK